MGLIAEPTRPRSSPQAADVYVFLSLACAITWLLDLPAAFATLAHRPLSPGALAMAGLGAFGPTLAALVVAGYRRELVSVFGRWHTSALSVALALLSVPALHLVATLTYAALGGTPERWFYPPEKPEHFAALVVFAIGEEFGWRGYAYPRLAERHGPVVGSLLVGVVWTFWHFFMWFTDDGPPSLLTLTRGMVELCLASLVMAWWFERGRRSMAIAIAFHAGAHLDNTMRASDGEARLQVLRMLAWCVMGGLAAYGLSKAEAKDAAS